MVFEIIVAHFTPRENIGTSAPPMWTAALESNFKNKLRGYTLAFTYGDLWETDAENLRTFVQYIVNVARKAMKHRYWETSPCSVSVQKIMNSKEYTYSCFIQPNAWQKIVFSNPSSYTPLPWPTSALKSAMLQFLGLNRTPHFSIPLYFIFSFSPLEKNWLSLTPLTPNKDLGIRHCCLTAKWEGLIEKQ